MATFESDNWARSEEAFKVREQVLRFPRMIVYGYGYRYRGGIIGCHDIPIEPPTYKKPADYEAELAQRMAVLNSALTDAKELFTLAAAWNRSVKKKKWKVYWCRRGYFPSASLEEWLDSHLETAENIFSWMDLCVQHGFGLYFDH